MLADVPSTRMCEIQRKTVVVNGGNHGARELGLLTTETRGPLPPCISLFWLSRQVPTLPTPAGLAADQDTIESSTTHEFMACRCGSNAYRGKKSTNRRRRSEPRRIDHGLHFLDASRSIQPHNFDHPTSTRQLP